VGGSRTLGLFDQDVKGSGIFDGDLRKHLAIELDAGMREAIDENAVTSSTHFACGGDSSDPETTEFTTTISTIAIGELAGSYESDLGLLLVTTLGSPVSASGSE
jgi:hypothetical protein